MHPNHTFQLDEFYLDLQNEGNELILLSKEEIAELPFPGLRPYKTSEWQTFFGRDGQVAELINIMKSKSFLAVIGSSGTGKSSLIRAALIPQLFGGYFSKAGNNWDIAVCRPGMDPIRNLAASMASLECDTTNTDTLLPLINKYEPILAESAFGLIEAKKVLNLGDPGLHKNLLVIVDQFEELFRFKRHNPDMPNIESHFVNLLIKAASLRPEGEESPNLYVIITMRSEFLGECVKYRGLPEIINKGQYLVPQLTRSQLREVIEKPLGFINQIISPQLTEYLINEVESANIRENLDQLPILQHALMRTYNSARAKGKNSIELNDYLETGGMKLALAQHADIIFDGLSTDTVDLCLKKQTASIIFKSITELTGDGKGGRRPTAVGEIIGICSGIGANSEMVKEVINAFRDKDVSFIMPPKTTAISDDLIIDISHESLMRNWDKLKDWMRDEFRNGVRYRRLGERRMDFEKADTDDKKNESFVQGILLSELENWSKIRYHNEYWAKRYHGLTQYGDIDKINEHDFHKEEYNRNNTFLKQSIKFQEKKLQEKEDEIVRKREEELKLKEDAKRKKRTRLITGISTLSAICFAFVSILAFRNSIEASKSEKLAIKQKTIADSLRIKAIQKSEDATRSADSAYFQKNRADALLIEAEKQTNLAKTESDRAKHSEKESKQLAMKLAKNLVVLKEKTKDLQLKELKELLSIDSAWYNDNIVLNQSNTDYIVNKLYPYFYEGRSKEEPDYISFIQSMEILNLGTKKKTDNFKSQLYYADSALKMNYNYITRSVFDSLINIAYRYNKELIIPGNYQDRRTNNYYRDNNQTIFLHPLSGGSDFIYSNASGIFKAEKSRDTLRQLSNLKGEEVVGVSNDGNYYFTWNQGKQEVNAKISGSEGSPMRMDMLNKRIKEMSGVNTNNILKSGSDNMEDIVDTSSFDLETIGIEKVAIAYSGKSHLIAMVTDDSLVIWDHIKSRPIAAYEKPASYYSVFRSISASPDGTSFLLEYFGDDEATFFLIGLNQQSFVQSAKQKGKSISTRENSSINELFKIYTTSAVGYFNNQGNIEILANEDYSISKYLYLISSGKRDTLRKIENGILIAEYDKITISKPDNRPFIIQEHATGNSSIIPLDALNSFQFPWHDYRSIRIAKYGDSYLSADDLRLYIWNENNSKLNQSDLSNIFDKNYRFGKSKEILNNPDMLSEERIQQLRNHLSDYPDDFDSWNELGEEYFAVDSFKSAVSSYQESLKLNPDQYDILFNIGKCYSSDSLYSESITYLHRANHLGNPDSSSINIYLAINHYFLSNCDSTLYYLNKTSVEGILVYSDFLYDVAICYMNKYGKLEELIRVIKAELDEIDDSNEGYVLLAYLYIKNGQLIEAEKSLRKVEVDNLSSTEYYHFVYACYYAVMNNKELMIQSLEKLGEDNIPYKELIEFEYEESFKKYKDDPRVNEIFKKFSDLDAER